MNDLWYEILESLESVYQAHLKDMDDGDLPDPSEVAVEAVSEIMDYLSAEVNYLITGEGIAWIESENLAEMERKYEDPPREEDWER